MYKIYASDNYIIVTKIQNNETFYGHKKNVFIDKSNVNKPVYSIFNVKDLKDNTIVAIGEIQKQDGSLYTEAEFDTFYRTNTGNFNGGGTAPTGGVESVTGDSVDNIDPLNPIINAVPLTGTTVGNPVTGTIETNSEVFIQTPTTQFTDDFAGLRIISEFGLTCVNTVNNAASSTTGNDIVIFKVSSPNPLARGISSEQDFSANITDLDYTQKIYVDNLIQTLSTATQTALDSKVSSALLGVVSGIATLGADSKLLTSQIPDSIIAGLKWQGTWDVATNTPNIPSASALNNGFFYKVNVVGTSSITGSSITYGLGDWLISNGTVWQHVPNVSTVNSFKGRVGDVIPSTGDYNQKQIKTIHDDTLVEGWFGVDNTGIYFETV
jgi:hypothetical protein